MTAHFALASLPKASLLAFFKAHGRLCMTSEAELHAKAAGLVVRARTLLQHGTDSGDTTRQLKAADEVSTLCAESLYSAGGFGAVTQAAAFSTSEALELLIDELELSSAMADPLRELRSRAAAIAAGSEIVDGDVFLAFQAMSIGEALLEWTTAQLETAMPVAGGARSAAVRYHA